MAERIFQVLYVLCVLWAVFFLFMMPPAGFRDASDLVVTYGTFVVGPFAGVLLLQYIVDGTIF